MMSYDPIKYIAERLHLVSPIFGLIVTTIYRLNFMHVT